MQEIHLKSPLKKIAFNNQRVFLRADLNVPLQPNGTIINDYRLQALKNTLDCILKNSGRIILATHIGRPQNHEIALSTKHLIPWFEHHGYSIQYVPDLENATTASKSLANDHILLLENLRFFPGEQDGDPYFAQELAQLADYYVFDAFAVAHRNDTSITLLPRLFSPEKRCIGLLVERELFELNKLLENPIPPFVLILGGGKVHDKLPLIKNLLEKVSTILLCPAIVFTFLKALGKPIGQSLCDNQSVNLCAEIMQQAHLRGIKLIYPIDYQVAKNSISGPLSIIDAQDFTSDDIGTSIGPKTVEFFGKYIIAAKTIFLNGAFGFADKPETLEGMKQLLEEITISSALSIIGGGDSVAIAQKFGFSDKISYLSTGGGATLTYLSGGKMPGLEVFLKN